MSLSQRWGGVQNTPERWYHSFLAPEWAVLGPVFLQEAGRFPCDEPQVIVVLEGFRTPALPGLPFYAEALRLGGGAVCVCVCVGRFRSHTMEPLDACVFIPSNSHFGLRQLPGRPQAKVVEKSSTVISSSINV